MIKVFGYLKRKPGQSLQEFADYYEHNHVPLVLSKAPMPLVCKRNYIQRGDSFIDRAATRAYVVDERTSAG
jgi:hypothetical protein